jgi:hypothetical protein
MITYTARATICYKFKWHRYYLVFFIKNYGSYYLNYSLSDFLERDIKFL